MSAPKAARLVPQPAAGGPFQEVVHVSSFVVTKKGGSLLLAKRSGPEFTAGKWVIPATVINYGEDPRAAAIRVVKEQLGVEAKETELIDVQSYGDKHWDICFVYQTDIPGIGSISPDIEKVDYFELQNLPLDLRSDHKEVIDTLVGRKVL
jgi:ADP-ribose pyrophosphatase YjhB (NUDIX family)